MKRNNKIKVIRKNIKRLCSTFTLQEVKKHSPVGSVTTPLTASSFTVTEGYLGILGVGSESVKNKK